MTGPDASGDGARPARGGRRPRVWTVGQARRAGLAAQGLHRPVREESGARSVRTVLERLGLLQVDSVNVLVRAHLMPLHSRLGAYEPAALERLQSRRPHDFTECWAHEASIVPARLRPHLVALQHRSWPTAAGMDAARREALVAEVLAAVDEHGPLTARQARGLGLGEGPEGGHWGWNWSEAKRVLEHLFADGTLASVGRSRSFERRYLRAERLWPDLGDALASHAPDDALAHALPLVEQSLRALGIATPASVADYYRLPVALTRRALEELCADGTAEAGLLAAGPGTGEEGTTTVPAFRHRLASVPRSATGTALLSPFDPMVFHRPRLEQLFGVRYRLGIYTPAGRRTRGYYSLLLLEGERLTAQVDLKADRTGPGTLLVLGAWTEPPGDHPDPATPPPGPGQTEAALADRLERLRDWLGLGTVVVPADAPGDLARSLRGR